METHVSGPGVTAYTDNGYRPQTTEIVSVTGFLCGVSKKHFGNDNTPLQMDIYKRLYEKKPSRKFRNLCVMRAVIQKNFDKINRQMQYDKQPTANIREFPTEAMNELEKDGIRIFDHRLMLADYLIRLNKYIQERVDTVKEEYPAWVNWGYVRDLFIVPRGTTKQGQLESAKTFFAYNERYPYGTFINWNPEPHGNILSSDKKFLRIIYQQHGDDFVEFTKVQDVSEKKRNAFEDFVKASGKTLFIVDCENADPFAFCATLKGMDPGMKGKISKILLCDDPNTSSAWQSLSAYIDIPVERIVSDRVIQHKSLVDVRLTAELCREHYTNSVDSFVLASSDSDYFGLIASMPSARFLIMIEHGKASSELKNRLDKIHVEYCNSDEFFTGNDDTLRTMTLIKEMRAYVEKTVRLNVNEMYEKAVIAARARMTDVEKDAFYRKWIRPMHLTFEEDGKVKIEFGKP